MDKRALSAIPRPIPTDKNKEILLLVPHISYLATASRRKVNGIDTLIINFFHTEKKELKPAFRTFCQPEDYITQDLTVDKTKWKTGAINYLTGYLYWYRNGGNIAVASVEERETILKFMREFKEKHNIKDYNRCMTRGRSVTDTELEDCIDEYQDKIKEWKLEKRHRKEKNFIDAEMEKFGELPDDYQTFIEEKVFKEDNYIFYDTKRKRAYCTGCKNTFILENKYLRHETIGIWNKQDEVKHNHKVHCPYCNKFLHAKSEGMSRQSLVSVQWSVLVQPHGEEVLTRYFCHIKDFRIDFHNPKITTSEGYRTVHTAEKATDYMWANYKRIGDIRWCYYRDRGFAWNSPAETVAPRSAMLYNTDLQEMVAGTCMRYSVPDIFIEKVASDTRHFKSPWLIDNYFNSYRKYPFVEQLLKVGFYKMVQEFFGDCWVQNYTLLHAGCNSILGTLGINKYQYNMLRKVGDPSLKDLKILRYKPDLKWEEFSSLRYVKDNGYVDMYKKYIDFMQYTTLHKLCKYIDAQKITHAQDYFDYAGWLEEMEYDMRNEFNLFPKNFKKTHDEMSKRYMKFKDKQAKEDIKKFNKILQKMKKETIDVEAMNLNVAGLFIRLPNKLEELKVEGEALHHCVGTYTERVRKGKTMIFFVRKIEEPDKPFYTLEWKGRVVQCRGFHNCDMTPEVKAFVEMFQTKMVEYEKTPKKHDR